MDRRVQDYQSSLERLARLQIGTRAYLTERGRFDSVARAILLSGNPLPSVSIAVEAGLTSMHVLQGLIRRGVISEAELRNSVQVELGPVGEGPIRISQINGRIIKAPSGYDVRGVVRRSVGLR